jgi:O2-independent ubiquinone biosynthesis accessory factor UbiT
MSHEAFTIPAFTVPRPLGRVIERLPTWPPSFALTEALNLLLHHIIRRGDLQALYGKRITIHVTDAGLHLYFTIDTSGFRAIAAHDSPPDLAISATAHDFTLLATRREDPDTLFFNRRLVVEGDTELGLVAKNTLDGIELPSLGGMLQPGRLLAQIGNRIRFG